MKIEIPNHCPKPKRKCKTKKREKKSEKKKMAANWRIKRNFSLRGEEGPWPGPRPDLTWSDLGRPGDPWWITRPQLYKYIRASRARIRSFLGVFPRGFVQCVFWAD